jgi:hypothetical protein
MSLEWLGEAFRFGGRATVTIGDTSLPTVASDAEAKAQVLVLTGTLTAPRAL